MLGPYGGTRVPTPNFDRLAKRSVTFDKHYVGSLPCMPARRDILTGRLNFLHRSWGPLEPFDNAFPELLHQAGIYSHLITDHFHYWEDGGATYHTATTATSSCAARRATAGRRWCSRTGSGCARCTIAPVQRRDAAHVPHARTSINREFITRGEGFPVGAVLRRTPSSSSTAIAMPTAGCCSSSPSTRTSRSIAPDALQEAVRHRLERPDPRLAALRPGRRADGGVRGAARQLLRADRRSATTSSARCSTISTRHDLWKDTALARHHRSRLPAGRARLLGQEPHEPLRGDRAHPAVRP